MIHKLVAWQIWLWGTGMKLILVSNWNESDGSYSKVTHSEKQFSLWAKFYRLQAEQVFFYKKQEWIWKLPLDLLRQTADVVIPVTGIGSEQKPIMK